MVTPGRTSIFRSKASSVPPSPIPSHAAFRISGFSFQNETSYLVYSSGEFPHPVRKTANKMSCSAEIIGLPLVVINSLPAEAAPEQHPIFTFSANSADLCTCMRFCFFCTSCCRKNPAVHTSQFQVGLHENLS